MPITVEEKIQLAKQINKIIAYAEDIVDTDLDASIWIDEWEKAKARFIEAFGGLTYEYPEPISFNLSDRAREDLLYHLCDNIQDYWNNNNLADFLFKQKNGFMENTVVSDYTAPDGTLIRAGGKLLKAFKYFEENKNVLREMQDAASMVIQEGKISGRLCVSVHPLDYLSSSENTYKWRSCHSLDGEYRAGNISYMLDTSTVVVYLKGAGEKELPNFPPSIPWNSKKWRMLLHVSDSGNEFFAGRQYPFVAPGALEAVSRYILPVIRGVKSEGPVFAPWNNHYITDARNGNGQLQVLKDKYLVMYHNLYELHKTVRTGKGALAFNDILMSSCYTPFYTYYLNNSSEKEEISFAIGVRIPCPCCGSDYVSDTGHFLCDDCFASQKGYDSFVYCTSCDCRIYNNDLYYIEGDLVCADCYEAEGVMCEDCGEVYYTDHIRYNREEHSYLCINCDFGGV